MIYKFVRNFLWNIRDSFRFSIRNIYRDTQVRRLDDDLLIEQILYQIPSSGVRRPNIKTSEETIQELVTSNKSLARFGDGEIGICDGIDLYYQNYDKRLAMRMKEILANEQENLCVAICDVFAPTYNIIERLRDTNHIEKYHYIYNVPRIRRMYDKYINYSIQYYSTQYFSTERRICDFEIWRHFFEGKKLVLTGCKEAFDNLKFNIYDTAQELHYEFVPNKNCFSVYDETLARLKAYNKEFIHILMCGPTACVLASDLCKEGFKALDLGHFAKHYDWYKRGIDVAATAENTRKFHSIDKKE